jgi:L-fuconolactonase
MAIAAATTLSPGVSAAASPVIHAIDTHIHLYDPSRPQDVPWPPKTDPLLYKTHLPEHFQSVTEKYDVVGAVVVEASAWLEDNQWVLDLAKDHPAIVGFIGNLILGQPEFAGQLKRFSANPLFRGLRLGGNAVARGLGQNAFADDLKRLADQQLTLDMIGGPSILPEVARVAKRWPGLRVVIDHLPFANWDKEPETMRRALAEVGSLPNVYAKVSEVARQTEGITVEDLEIYRPRLDVLWELFGPDRAIFGSNWPVSNRTASYASLHKIVADYFNAKGSSAAEKFFWKNSLTAYRWQPRGAAAKLTNFP